MKEHRNRQPRSAVGSITMSSQLCSRTPYCAACSTLIRTLDIRRTSSTQQHFRPFHQLGRATVAHHQCLNQYQQLSMFHVILPRLIANLDIAVLRGNSRPKVLHEARHGSRTCQSTGQTSAWILPTNLIRVTPWPSRLETFRLTRQDHLRTPTSNVASRRPAREYIYNPEPRCGQHQGDTCICWVQYAIFRQRFQAFLLQERFEWHPCQGPHSIGRYRPPHYKPGFRPKRDSSAKRRRIAGAAMRSYMCAAARNKCSVQIKSWFRESQ